MHIFTHELKQNWVTALIWTVILFSVIALFISVYPLFVSQSGFGEIVENFPEAFKQLMGAGGLDFNTFPAYYSMMFQLVTLAAAVYAMGLGVGIVSKEIQGKTAEFLLTKPVKRYVVLFQKLISALTILITMNVVLLMGTWLMIQRIVEDHFDFVTFMQSTITLFLVQMFFLGLGFMLGCMLPKVKRVIAISLPTVFGFYVVGMLDTVIGVDKIKFLTPFKFQIVADLASGQNLDGSTMVLLVVFVVITTTVGFTYYQKRDIFTI